MTAPSYPVRRPLIFVERPVDLTKPGDAPENAPLPPTEEQTADDE